MTTPSKHQDWQCGLTTEQVGKLANDEAKRWISSWPNHDGFLNAYGTAFADGFMRGFRVRDDMSKTAGWQPLETAPRDGTYILLAGPSGYMGTPLRVEVCRHDAGYHPLQPWVNYANNSFMDGGEAPTCWMPLP